MKTGDLIKVGGRLATVKSEVYTRLVVDYEDRDAHNAGYDMSSACSFVDVVYNETGKTGSINISRNRCEVVS